MSALSPSHLLAVFALDIFARSITLQPKVWARFTRLKLDSFYLIYLFTISLPNQKLSLMINYISAEIFNRFQF